MSKQSKALERLRREPTPSNFKWDDLASLLCSLGYTEINGAGSRKKFFHAEKNALISCHKPHPNPDVDKGCIVDVVKHLKDHKFIK
ncbi:MAG: type II toxin-antitoxin system HicA family toxin [Polaromonas sp.]